MHTYLTVPLSDHAGLTSASIGLVRALDRIGLRVGFFKPIGQAFEEHSQDFSTAYVRSISSLHPPEPLSMEETEQLMASGQIETILEKIAEKHQKASEGCDVLIVEGLKPSTKHHFLNQLNPRIAQALNSEVILVGSLKALSYDERIENSKDFANHLNRRLEASSRSFGGLQNKRLVGLLLNEGSEIDSNLTLENIQQETPLLRDGIIKLLGFIPYKKSLTHLRTSDLVAPLNTTTLHKGDIHTRRVTQIHLCAREIAHITQVYHAGSLVVTPADRSDIILGSAYASLKGIPLAGLVLTGGGIEPEPSVLDFCKEGFSTGLPVLSVDIPSFQTARILSSLSPEIPVDDTERLEQVVDHVARHIDSQWLKEHCNIPRKLRLSPPAFRHQISRIARSAPKRIVLPEGEEPRTLAAAAICAHQGLAIPVLLGRKETIIDVAKRHDIDLHPSLEILNPADYRSHYIAPLMELRKHKHLTEQQAISQLEDTITLGTMMLHQGVVDGLVSGAIHSTADTIRPALQLIRTAPEAKSVSSVFFMCLPEQVLVYGDCAINLDPNPEQLADIAIQSAQTAQAFGIEPRVAMISYSTHDSGSGANVEKVKAATSLVKQNAPNMLVDGPLQYDAASNEQVAVTKAPDSNLKGDATVFIFPDLNTGNTTYKAVQRAGNVISMGPVLQGLAKPVNDLSRGASIEDIVFTIAITAIQAQRQ